MRRTGGEEADMGLQISERKSGNVTILDLRGRIVYGADSESFSFELRELAAGSPRNVLINLAGVAQVDSSGISVLVQSFVTLSRAGGSLKILNPTGYVLEVLEVTGLIGCLPAYTDEAEALASFHGSAAHA
jgi:anti-anti-sigma factor